MFQREAMRDVWQGGALGLSGAARWWEVPGQAPTAVQRLALALISLGMLMGTTILLTIMAAKASASRWMVFPLLFAAAVVSINVVFNHKIW